MPMFLRHAMPHFTPESSQFSFWSSHRIPFSSKHVVDLAMLVFIYCSVISSCFNKVDKYYTYSELFAIIGNEGYCTVVSVAFSHFDVSLRHYFQHLLHFFLMKCHSITGTLLEIKLFITRWLHGFARVHYLCTKSLPYAPMP